MKQLILNFLVLCLYVCYSIQNGFGDNVSQVSNAAVSSKHQNQMLMIIGGRRGIYSGELTHAIAFVNGTWLVQGALPRTMLKNPKAIRIPGNKVVAVGGWGRDYYYDYETCHIFDPATNEWKTGPSLKVSRHSHCVASIGTKIYAIGGIGDYQVSLNTTEVWDMSQGESPGWQIMSHMAKDRVNAAAVVWRGDIYVTGGIKNYGSAAKYNVQENRWVPIPNMLFDRSYHGLVVFNDKIYAIGGSIYTNSTVLNSCESFDGEKWVLEPSMNEAREGHSVGVIGGKIYAIGGFRSYTIINNTESYDPSTGVWSIEKITGESPIPISFGSAVVLDV